MKGRMYGIAVRRVWICLLLGMFTVTVQGQALRGTTGLLHAPTAEMQRDYHISLVRGGLYLHAELCRRRLHLFPISVVGASTLTYASCPTGKRMMSEFVGEIAVKYGNRPALMGKLGI